MRKIYLIYFLLVDDFKLVIIIELCPSHGNAHWLVWFKFLCFWTANFIFLSIHFIHKFIFLFVYFCEASAARISLFISIIWYSYNGDAYRTSHIKWDCVCVALSVSLSRSSFYLLCKYLIIQSWVGAKAITLKRTSSGSRDMASLHTLAAS